MSTESLKILDHIVRLARHSTGADYVELSVGENPDIEVTDGGPLIHRLDRAAINQAFHHAAVGPTNGNPLFPGFDDGSFAIHPVTGPSAEAGWLLVLSTKPHTLSSDTFESLSSAVRLAERCLDETVERIRLDQISDVLRINQTELRDAQARLELSNSELEQFAYIAAHELLSPLRNVVVYADLLQTSDLDQAQIQNCAKEIRRSVSLMDQQLHYLLELSSTQREAADPQPVDVTQVAQGAIDNLKDALEESNTKVNLAELSVVGGREVLLQSVFVNLISNAIKYRDPNHDLVISIEGEQDASGSRVFVSDTGPGIDEQHRDRIFQLFERASTSTPGSGIGLGLSRRIVEAFGGSISYEERDSGGSRFVLAFPPFTPSE